jgi:hypothetical protein
MSYAWANVVFTTSLSAMNTVDSNMAPSVRQQQQSVAGARSDSSHPRQLGETAQPVCAQPGVPCSHRIADNPTLDGDDADCVCCRGID